MLSAEFTASLCEVFRHASVIRHLTSSGSGIFATGVKPDVIPPPGKKEKRKEKETPPQTWSSHCTSSKSNPYKLTH